MCFVKVNINESSIPMGAKFPKQLNNDFSTFCFFQAFVYCIELESL